MNLNEVFKMLIPVLVAAIAWLLGQVSSFQTRLVELESKMPALITPEGVPTDSPISADRRHQMKEEIYNHIHDLQVRVKLIEERSQLMEERSHK
jgi:hypothetical protein